MFNRRIYLDYAALTPVDKVVQREIKKYSSQTFANPSAFYKEGVRSKKALDGARKNIADLLSAHPEEIFFTSGGTESNNIAILGLFEKMREMGVAYEKMRFLTSSVEHSSVRECANSLASLGVNIDLVKVLPSGLIDVDDLRKKIKAETVLISVMMVNNEIGTIQPIREIAKIVRHAQKQFFEKGPFNFQNMNLPLFHTDASQAIYEELHMPRLGIDLLTLDASKMYGPRGVGLLFKKKAVDIKPLLHGGGQEKGLRSGTENIPGIMGFEKALALLSQNKTAEASRLAALRSHFLHELKKIDEVIVENGANSTPHILNVSIPFVDSEFFILELDARGVAASTKSSCLRDEDESYVLKSIGVDSRHAIRFSFGRFTTKKQLDRVLQTIRDLLSRKRY